MEDFHFLLRHFEFYSRGFLNRHVFSTAGMAGPATGIAGGQHRIQAETGNQHGQQGQTKTSFYLTKLLWN